MQESIYCLYADGGALNARARNFLYEMACLMVLEDKKAFSFRDEAADAEINLRTTFQFKCLGTLTGTHFDGIIEEAGRTIRTSFIIRNTDFTRNLARTVDWVPMTADDPVLKSSMN